MTQDQPWTIGRLLGWTADYLKQNGAESPRLDAEILLAEARGCQRIELYTAYDEPASDETRSAFRELVRRRSEGTPVAYLIGRREFYSLNFRVTPDVLIPRPETELLVVAALDRAKQASSPNGNTIADVGTGSGIIAICLAKNLPTARLTATDISAAALQVAAENVAQHDVADRVELIESDLLAAVSADRRYDIIASNPPYVRADEMDNLPPDVRDHEPRQALLAGPTGTELIERLTDQAAERLVSGGWLLLEISPTIVDAAEAIIEKDDRLDRHGTIKDLAGLPRVIQAQRRTATP